MLLTSGIDIILKIKLKLLNSLKSYLLQIIKMLTAAAKDGTLLTKYNVGSVVIFGGIGHPLYYFLHFHLFGQKWQNFFFSISAGIFCLLLSTGKKWPKKVKFLFPFYWHFVLIFNLPFLVTLIAFGNGFVDVWPAWWIAMIFSLIMLVPNFFMFIFDMVVGLAAVFIYKLIVPDYGYIEATINFYWYFTVVAFALIAGTGFSYGNLKGAKQEVENKTLRSLAGSIAHELRNPFAAVSLATENNKDILGAITKNQNSLVSAHNNQLQEVMDNSNTVLSAIKRGNDIINITLNELKGEKPNSKSFVNISAIEAINKAVKEYGYKSNDERKKVVLDLIEEKNFTFKGDESLFIYIIFNLIKNSLYYTNSYPNSVVTIGTEKRKVNDKNYNVIYVHDSGPGVPAELLSKLFGDFVTSGKEGGTGLGLAFCKRTMLAFNGEIICESDATIGKSWTKFSLLFPSLSEEELKMITDSKLNGESEVKSQEKTKILLVDDQEINLKVTKKRIEKTFPHISCDMVLDGKEAVKALSKARLEGNQYGLVLLDIQMPYMNGIETAKEIREEIGDDILIIALTSLNHREFVTQLKISMNGVLNNPLGNFNYYLNKSSPANILYRAITKWLVKQDDFAYLGEENNYHKFLQGKKVILADDQEINLMVTKKKLMQYGVIVDTLMSGKELIEKYKSSLDVEARKSQYDMILTDINMPLLKGDEAAKEIRKIEEESQILHRNMIPIIALTGDGDKEDVLKFFKSEMTDYFVKGNDPEFLIKIMANYLKAINPNEYGSDFNKIIDEVKNENVEDKKGSQAEFKSNLGNNNKAENVKVKNNAEVQNNDLVINSKPNTSNSNSAELSDFNLKKLELLTNHHQEEIKKIISLFLSESQNLMTQIKENHELKNIEALHTAVHTLKGISHNVGADKLFSYIKETGLEIKDQSFLNNKAWVQNLEIIYQNTKKKVEEALR